jgi:membrane protein DedA with SNARE-associated domain
MKKWVRSGLVWAGLLYIITMVLFPLIDHERFDIAKILLGIPLWIIVGLIIGYFFERRKHKKKLNP